MAVAEANQPTLHAQIADLSWNSVPIAHSDSDTGHGRRESLVDQDRGHRRQPR